MPPSNSALIQDLDGIALGPFAMTKDEKPKKGNANNGESDEIKPETGAGSKQAASGGASADTGFEKKQNRCPEYEMGLQGKGAKAKEPCASAVESESTHYHAQDLSPESLGFSRDASCVEDQYQLRSLEPTDSHSQTATHEPTFSVPSGGPECSLISWGSTCSTELDAERPPDTDQNTHMQPEPRDRFPNRGRDETVPKRPYGDADYTAQRQRGGYEEYSYSQTHQPTSGGPECSLISWGSTCSTEPGAERPPDTDQNTHMQPEPRDRFPNRGRDETVPKRPYGDADYTAQRQRGGYEEYSYSQTHQPTSGGPECSLISWGSTCSTEPGAERPPDTDQNTHMQPEPRDRFPNPNRGRDETVPKRPYGDADYTSQRQRGWYEKRDEERYDLTAHGNLVTQQKKAGDMVDVYCSMKNQRQADLHMRRYAEQG